MRKRLTREKLIQFIAILEPCTIGLEASTGAHYWARTFQSYDDEVSIGAACENFSSEIKGVIRLSCGDCLSGL